MRSTSCQMPRQIELDFGISGRLRQRLPHQIHTLRIVSPQPGAERGSQSTHPSGADSGPMAPAQQLGRLRLAAGTWNLVGGEIEDVGVGADDKVTEAEQFALGGEEDGDRKST